MYFVLSKVLLVFIYPLTWVIALLLAGIIVKKQKLKARLIISSIVVLLLFSNKWLLNLFSSVWDIAPHQVANGNKYSAAIILGGYASIDGNGNGYFNSASNRFLEALILNKRGIANYLLISGGDGRLKAGLFNEGVFIKEQTKYLSIPDSTVLVDTNSRNTIENALFSKKILDKAGLKPPYLLVTSTFHMRRAQYIFNKYGVNVVPYACNFDGNSRAYLSALLPDANVLNCWNIYIKEIIGLVAAYIKPVSTA